MIRQTVSCSFDEICRCLQTIQQFMKSLGTDVSEIASYSKIKFCILYKIITMNYDFIHTTQLFFSIFKRFLNKQVCKGERMED